MNEQRNLTSLTDLYQLTMMQGYYNNDTNNHEVVFDLFYRKNPSKNGYAICAGLSQTIEYIQNLSFNDADIAYLDSLNIFQKDFLEYLKNFKFTGDIDAIPEGTVVFPMEVLMRIKAPIFEAQFVETALLNMINHQSLIATKAARVVKAAEGDPILEFGLRRAQGPDAGIYGARAAIIGGCAGTSNVLTGQMFNVPISGTHAHSWVMSFDEEIEAFRAYAKLFPDACILLVDTYDTLKSGIPNAIRVAEEVLQPMGKTLAGIRIDSGDIAYLTKKARMMLDVAGLTDTKISISNSLDEYLIRSVLEQGARIDSFGVGENMITSKSSPVFGGVYKMAAMEKDGQIVPKIKISENKEKITNPGYKKVYRLIENETNKAIADIVMFADETIDPEKNLTIYSQYDKWKNKTLIGGSYTFFELQEPIFVDGECVYEEKTLEEIRENVKKQGTLLWDEIFRLEYPHTYYVDLSERLIDYKLKMLEEKRG